MTRILITGGFLFPNDAAALRALGFGKALRAAGHDIFFAGFEEPTRPDDDVCHYQDFPYKSLGGVRSKSRSLVGRLKHYWTNGSQVLDFLKSETSPDFDLAIALGGSAQFLGKLHRYCRKAQIRLVCDWCEWLNVFQYEGRFLSPAFFSRETAIRCVTPKIGNVIAISRYFQDYFQKKGCHVIRIPNLLDFEEPRWQFPIHDMSANDDTLKLVYAGFPGKKDLLIPALQGALQAIHADYPVEIHIYGAEAKDIGGSTPQNDSLVKELGDGLFFHGNISPQEIPRKLAEYDASFLLRPNLRYAHAGFATKVQESLAAGVPVLTNDTSDIWEYMTDGQDGIRVAGEKPDDFFAAIRQWFGLNKEKRIAMRHHARKCAEKHFAYQNHVEHLNDFIARCG